MRHFLKHIRRAGWDVADDSMVQSMTKNEQPDGTAPIFFLSDVEPDDEDLVEEMARGAHNAWWRAYQELGYTSRKAAWGEEFMVEFDALSEQGKEFDRVIMRGILDAFADKDYVVAKFS